MGTAAVVTGTSPVIIPVIALESAVWRRNRDRQNRYRRAIPNLIRARERREVWPAGTADAAG
jgi:hypothetical protein